MGVSGRILPLMFVLAGAHGTPLGEFDARAEALDALAELVEADPSAAHDCRVIELNADGRRVGSPLAHPAAA